MKIIIAGSRTITRMNKKIIVDNTEFLCLGNPLAYALLLLDRDNCGFKKKEITEVVSGCAKGVDKLGEEWAKLGNIPVKHFPANWNKYGKKAGYLRNIEMANYADALIAVWDGKSKGTKHMIDIANKKGLKVYIYKVEK